MQDNACRETRKWDSQVSVELHVIGHVVSHNTNLLLPSRAARHLQHHGTCVRQVVTAQALSGRLASHDGVYPLGLVRVDI